MSGGQLSGVNCREVNCRGGGGGQLSYLALGFATIDPSVIKRGSIIGGSIIGGSITRGSIIGGSIVGGSIIGGSIVAVPLL